MNKRGGEKIMSVWWFFVLVIVGVGITSGVLLFYSADVNVKQTEADILYDKIAECIFENGFLIDEFLKNDFDIFETCDLNKGIIDGGDFYFKISTDIRKDIVKGDKSFEVLQDSKGPHLPRFGGKTENIFYYQNNEIKEAEIEILTASNQIGKKF